MEQMLIALLKQGYSLTFDLETFEWGQKEGRRGSLSVFIVTLYGRSGDEVWTDKGEDLDSLLRGAMKKAKIA